MSPMAPTLTAHDRITALIREHGETQAAWAARLDMSREAVADRMRGRTPWTLADAITVADVLEVSLDTLVGLSEDLPLGYRVTGLGAAQGNLDRLAGPQGSE